MSIEIDRIAPDLEGALERARSLAEDQNLGEITPAHVLYVLFQSEPSISALAGAQSSALQAGLLKLTKQSGAPTLQAGKRPIGSRALRSLMEAGFEQINKHGIDRLRAVDLIQLAFTVSDEAVRRCLAESGLSKESFAKAAEKQVAAREVLPADGASPQTNLLMRFGRDLTAAARKGELMPVIGRDSEVEQMQRILLRLTKNNPVIVGDPGTGKTAIVEGLAQRIAAGNAPDSLRGCRIVSLDLTSMVAGAKYRGEFEERLRNVVNEVQASKGEIILFLDEIHTLVGAGGTEGGMDAANILKPPLARGELRCIGATTHDEYRERIEKDGALERRFQPVVVKEPSDEDMLALLRGIRPRYEKFHGVRVPDASLHTSIKLSRRYLRNRFLPDKAIDVLDLACARIRLRNESRPENISLMERRLNRLIETAGDAGAPDRAAEIAELQAGIAKEQSAWESRKQAGSKLRETVSAIAGAEAELDEAEKRKDTARAAEIRYGSLKYLQIARADLEQQLAASGGDTDEVLPEHIAEVVAERAGVPVQRMLESERERLMQLEERLAGSVYGQDEAISVIAEAVRAMRVDLQLERKPTSFLCIGPTGVGKTELARSLARALFDDEQALIRIDMGEYKDQSAVAGLIGSRPGLVGSDQGGFLTERVRRMPYSVVLFDEIEKAHSSVFDLLLGVLDEGRLTDAKGRFCDFTNAIVLFTSNLGVAEALAASDDPARQQELILEYVRASLRPEFINRLSHQILFRPLGLDELRRIVVSRLSSLGQRLVQERGIRLEYQADSVDLLTVASHDPAYGARPVGRTVQRMVLSPLASFLLSGSAVEGDTVRIERIGDELEFTVAPRAAGAAV